jgi:hypothetical protein
VVGEEDEHEEHDEHDEQIKGKHIHTRYTPVVLVGPIHQTQLNHKEETPRIEFLMRD